MRKSLQLNVKESEMNSNRCEFILELKHKDEFIDRIYHGASLWEIYCQYSWLFKENIWNRYQITVRLPSWLTVSTDANDNLQLQIFRLNSSIQWKLELSRREKNIPFQWFWLRKLFKREYDCSTENIDVHHWIDGILETYPLGLSEANPEFRKSVHLVGTFLELQFEFLIEVNEHKSHWLASFQLIDVTFDLWALQIWRSKYHLNWMTRVEGRMSIHENCGCLSVLTKEKSVITRSSSPISWRMSSDEWNINTG